MHNHTPDEARMIVEAALANEALMAMWEESNHRAEIEGTEDWLTLEALMDDYGIPPEENGLCP